MVMTMFHSPAQRFKKRHKIDGAFIALFCKKGDSELVSDLLNLL